MSIGGPSWGLRGEAATCVGRRDLVSGYKPTASTYAPTYVPGYIPKASTHAEANACWGFEAVTALNLRRRLFL